MLFHPLFLLVFGPGVLESLGSLASRIIPLLQPQQQLTPQQLRDLTGLSEALVDVIGTLGMAWPQNIFKAKAFEQCLQPWVDLAAVLPTAAVTAESRGASAGDAPRSRGCDVIGSSMLPSVTLTGMCLAANIVTAPGADKGCIAVTSKAIQRLCQSDSLHKVLAWNFAIATYLKHHKADGTFQATAFFEGAASSSSRVKQLQVPPHHEQLLSDFNVASNKPPISTATGELVIFGLSATCGG